MNCNCDLAIASGSQLSFLVVSAILSILQVGAIKFFKLQVGCNCNLQMQGDRNLVLSSYKWIATENQLFVHGLKNQIQNL
jgi:hypothetical protein